MRKYYKLLNQNMTSYKGTKWEVDIPIKIDKPGNKMFSDEVLHCYNHPLLASFLNRSHANMSNPRLFTIEVDSIVNSDGLVFTSKSQKILEEIPYFDISLEKRVKIAITIAKTIYKDEEWNLWADRWLSGEDRRTENTVYASDVRCAAYASFAANTFSDRVKFDGDADWYASYSVDNANAVSSSKEEFNQKLIETIESFCKE